MTRDRRRGSRLLGNAGIAAAIREGQQAQWAKAELSASRVLEELRRVAFSDVRHVFDPQGNLVGFASALRRAELVSLNVEDVVPGPDGLTITLRRSKTDQEGAGRVIGVPFGSAPAVCPVRALAAWLTAAGITEGAIFRGVSRHGALLGRLSGRGVARVVQRGAAAVGLEAATFGGHSLRAGLTTAAAMAGKSERSIMSQTGHRSVTMVRRYIRAASVFTDNAAAGLL
jgi:integrase